MSRKLWISIGIVIAAALGIVLTLRAGGERTHAEGVDGIYWGFYLNPPDPVVGEPFTVTIYPSGYSGSPFMFSTLYVTQGDPPTVQVKSQVSNTDWVLTPLQEGKVTVRAVGAIEKTDCPPDVTPPPPGLCFHMFYVGSPNFSIDVGAALQDADADGCPDVNEQQYTAGSELTGGQRDYLNPYDYFNPTQDGQNRVDDILAVVDQYHKDDTDGNDGLPPYAPGYNPDTDRTLPMGAPHAWSLSAPNGLQRVDDILNEVHQYFHDCG